MDWLFEETALNRAITFTCHNVKLWWECWWERNSVVMTCKQVNDAIAVSFLTFNRMRWYWALQYFRVTAPRISCQAEYIENLFKYKCKPDIQLNICSTACYIVVFPLSCHFLPRSKSLYLFLKQFLLLFQDIRTHLHPAARRGEWARGWCWG